MPPCTTCAVPSATVYCPADRAYLCTPCDTHIHTANKVASRHVRVPVHSTVDSVDSVDMSDVSDIINETRATLPDTALADMADICVRLEAHCLLRNVLCGNHAVPREDARDNRRAALTRLRTKRANRSFRKTVRYECRKQLADSRPRVKGRFVGRSSHQSQDSRAPAYSH